MTLCPELLAQIQNNFRQKFLIKRSFKNIEYDQDTRQSQTVDKPVASLGRTAQQSQDIRKENKAIEPALSSPSRGLQN